MNTTIQNTRTVAELVKEPGFLGLVYETVMVIDGREYRTNLPNFMHVSAGEETLGVIMKLAENPMCRVHPVFTRQEPESADPQEDKKPLENKKSSGLRGGKTLKAEVLRLGKKNVEIPIKKEEVIADQAVSADVVPTNSLLEAADQTELRDIPETLVDIPETPADTDGEAF